MTAEQKEKARNIWVTLTPYIGAVVLDIALCGLLVVSGKELTPEAIVAITTCVGALLFFHKKADGNNTMMTGGMLLVASSMLMSCGVPCQTERSVLRAVEAGLDAAELQLDMDNDDIAITMSAARGTHVVGEVAAESCELLRDKGGWQDWVAWALEAVAGVIALFGAAAEDTPTDPPEELIKAVDVLENAL